MSTTLTGDIPNHYSTEFSANWIARLGQKKSRLGAFVEDVDCTGERKRFNRIGAVDSQEITTRHDDTRWSDVGMDLRWAYHKAYDVAQPFDEFDAKMLGEVTLPDSPLVKQHTQAYFRDCDDNAWKAAIGDAMTGKEGSTAVALPAAQKIAHGSAGMTLDKLISTLDILDGADELDDEGMDGEAMRVFIWTVKQRSELLNTAEVKSADYNTIKALAQGKIDTFMGFKFKLIKRLPLSGGVRTNIAWHKGAVKQIKHKVGTDISRRKDKNNAIQLRTVWRLGAVRVHDEAVVEIACQES